MPSTRNIQDQNDSISTSGKRPSRAIQSHDYADFKVLHAGVSWRLGCVIIPLFAGAIRSSVNRSTGFTPNYLMLGREVMRPLDLMLPKIFGDVCSREANFVTKYQTAFQRDHEIARQNLKAAQFRQKRDYDVTAGLAGGIYRRYLPPVFTGKYRRGQYSQKWRLPAFTGIYKYLINFSSNYIVDSPSYLLYYTWTP